MLTLYRVVFQAWLLVAAVSVVVAAPSSEAGQDEPIPTGQRSADALARQV